VAPGVSNDKNLDKPVKAAAKTAREQQLRREHAADEQRLRHGNVAERRVSGACRGLVVGAA
jgi:hypothetical protein